MWGGAPLVWQLLSILYEQPKYRLTAITRSWDVLYPVKKFHLYTPTRLRV